MVMSEPVGILAGYGLLPELVAKGIHASGRPVVCVAFRDSHETNLPEFCDQFATAGIIQLGRQIRLFKKWGVREALMVGKLDKTRMFRPGRLWRQLPDWRMAKLWFGKLRHDKRTDFMLQAVIDEFALAGITMTDTTQYIPEHLADVGSMTCREPSASQRGDIDFAIPIVQRMGDLDIGQAIAVRDREVIAVEAIEGTDAMMERASQLCPMGGWTLVKLAKPNQDLRFDVPVVGVNTIEKMKALGASCLAVEAGRLIMLDKPRVIDTANRLGIAIVGVKPGVD